MAWNKYIVMISGTTAEKALSVVDREKFIFVYERDSIYFKIQSQKSMRDALESQWLFSNLFNNLLPKFLIMQSKEGDVGLFDEESIAKFPDGDSKNFLRSMMDATVYAYLLDDSEEISGVYELERFDGLPQHEIESVSTLPPFILLKAWSYDVEKASDALDNVIKSFFYDRVYLTTLPDSANLDYDSDENEMDIPTTQYACIFLSRSHYNRVWIPHTKEQPVFSIGEKEEKPPAEETEGASTSEKEPDKFELPVLLDLPSFKLVSVTHVIPREPTKSNPDPEIIMSKVSKRTNLWKRLEKELEIYHNEFFYPAIIKDHPEFAGRHGIPLVEEIDEEF